MVVGLHLRGLLDGGGGRSGQRGRRQATVLRQRRGRCPEGRGRGGGHSGRRTAVVLGITGEHRNSTKAVLSRRLGSVVYGAGSARAAVQATEGGAVLLAVQLIGLFR